MKQRLIKALLGILTLLLLPAIAIVHMIVWVINGEGFIDELAAYLLDNP